MQTTLRNSLRALLSGKMVYRLFDRPINLYFGLCSSKQEYYLKTQSDANAEVINQATEFTIIPTVSHLLTHNEVKVYDFTYALDFLSHYALDFLSVLNCSRSGISISPLRFPLTGN